MTRGRLHVSAGAVTFRQQHRSHAALAAQVRPVLPNMKPDPTAPAPTTADPKTLRQQLQQAKIEANRTAEAAGAAKAHAKDAKKAFKQARKAAKQARKALKALLALQAAAAPPKSRSHGSAKVRRLVPRNAEITRQIAASAMMETASIAPPPVPPGTEPVAPPSAGRKST